MKTEGLALIIFFQYWITYLSYKIKIMLTLKGIEYQ